MSDSRPVIEGLDRLGPDCTCSESDWPVHRHVRMTAPDRPGDRDQQQAAEVVARRLAGAGPRDKGITDAEYRQMARAVSTVRAEGWRAGWQEGTRQFAATVSAGAATARAEEAARWRAKIEALADRLDRDADDARYTYESRNGARFCADRIRELVGCTCRDTFNPKCPEHGGNEHHP